MELTVGDPVKRNAFHARQDSGDLVGSFIYYHFLAWAFALFILCIRIYTGVMVFPLRPDVPFS